jgi:hypothetical protein
MDTKAVEARGIKTMEQASNEVGKETERRRTEKKNRRKSRKTKMR